MFENRPARGWQLQPRDFSHGTTLQSGHGIPPCRASLGQHHVELPTQRASPRVRDPQRPRLGPAFQPPEIEQPRCERRAERARQMRDARSSRDKRVSAVVASSARPPQRRRRRCQPRPGARSRWGERQGLTERDETSLSLEPSGDGHAQHTGEVIVAHAGESHSVRGVAFVQGSCRFRSRQRRHFLHDHGQRWIGGWKKRWRPRRSTPSSLPFTSCFRCAVVAEADSLATRARFPAASGRPSESVSTMRARAGSASNRAIEAISASAMVMINSHAGTFHDSVN